MSFVSIRRSFQPSVWRCKSRATSKTPTAAQRQTGGFALVSDALSKVHASLVTVDIARVKRSATVF